MGPPKDPEESSSGECWGLNVGGGMAAIVTVISALEVNCLDSLQVGVLNY